MASHHQGAEASTHKWMNRFFKFLHTTLFKSQLLSMLFHGGSLGSDAGFGSSGRPLVLGGMMGLSWKGIAVHQNVRRSGSAPS